MIAKAVPVQRVIVDEGPQAAPIESSYRGTLFRLLLERGYSVSLRKDGQFPHHGGQLVVVGQFLNGSSESGSSESGSSESKGPAELESSVHRIDLTGKTPEEAVSLIDQVYRPEGSGSGPRWKPWFPVIDYNRCTNCMQCLSFCLFDVYGVTPDGKITVQNESNCKTDCPACSRVCPEVAILFPKYKAGPINGDEVNADDLRREAMKVDISALLGGDIYSMLRDRSAKAKSRFSKERDDERALKERQRCLQKMKDGIASEIPPEVLSSLPSLDEIQSRAAKARERAAAALAKQAESTGQ
jgi:Ferredoxin